MRLAPVFRRAPLMAFAAWLFAAPGANAQPSVFFHLDDLVELGLIRQIIQPAYEELDIDHRRVDASINWVALGIRTIAQAGDIAQVTNAVTVTATLADTINQSIQTLSADTLQQISDALSPIDYSGTTDYLRALDQGMAEVNSQILDPILPPTLYVGWAASVSARAVDVIRENAEAARSGRQSLENALTNIGGHLDTIDALTAQSVLVQQTAPQLAQAVLEGFGRIPGFTFVVEAIILDLTAIEGQQAPLRQDLSRARAQLYATAQRIAHRAGELDDLIAGLDSALSATPISSTWETWAQADNSGGLYDITFTGRTFTHSYTEIDGPFQLGVLHVTNYISPQGDVYFDATLQFHVQRWVPFPGRGLVPTAATVSLPMSYFASTNDPEQSCGPSRDHFAIPSLGVNVYICEEFTRDFVVWGQYDSPLRIVAIEALPDDRDPDPAEEHFAHTLHVNRGSGTGVYEPKTVVPVVATVPSGMQFVRWDGDVALLADPIAPETDLTIGDSNANIEAVLEPVRELRQLTVVDGRGSGTYAVGAEVGIIAVVPEHLRFGRWVGDVEGVQDPSAAITVVRVTADAQIAVQLECGADFNSDDVVTSQDLFDFLTSYFATPPTADFNRDGVVGVADFYQFLAAFFAGCP